MPSVQLPLAAPPHQNQQLFSDHYLNVILPARPDWRMAEAEAARLLAEIQAIFAAYTPSANEAQTQRGFPGGGSLPSRLRR